MKRVRDLTSFSAYQFLLNNPGFKLQRFQNPFFSHQGQSLRRSWADLYLHTLYTFSASGFWTQE
jgi:hypothetical protein